MEVSRELGMDSVYSLTAQRECGATWLKKMERVYLDASVLKMTRAHDVVGAVDAVQDVDDDVLDRVHSSWADSAGMALSLIVGIGTIVVEAVAGNVGEGRENMDVVGSHGTSGGGVKEVEVCRAFHAVFAHCEEV